MQIEANQENIFSKIYDLRKDLSNLNDTAIRDAKKLIASTKILKRVQTANGYSYVIEHNGVKYNAYGIKTNYGEAWKVAIGNKVVNADFRGNSISVLRLAIAVGDVGTSEPMKYSIREFN